MPITKSAKKALRGSLVKKAANDRNKKNIKEAVKQIEKLLKDKKNTEAQKLIPDIYSVIDKAAKRGVIKKNTASRKKSRISRMVK
jgi:small subunit ribosomal protein S20